MAKILITGATGSLGKAVVEQLLNRTAASNLSVLVRDEAKAGEYKAQGIAARVGNYDDYGSLVSAFRGTDKLYFISGNDITQRMAQQENVVKAAQEAGVKHVFYTSFQRKNESADSPIAQLAEGHIVTERLLQASGLIYTILRHNIYMDFIPVFAGDKVLETGTVFFPSGDGKINVMLRSEMAEIGANVLTQNGHENKVYNISGAVGYSFGDVANIISALTGKTVKFVSPDIETYKNVLQQAGVPKEYVEMFAGFGAAFSQGEFDTETSDGEALLGRKSATLEDFLGKVFAVAAV
ncbi:MAG: SDR family oxidoreductase [Chitinophagaceae bacterium]